MGSVVARKSPWRDAAQFLQIAIGQDGMRQLQRVAVLRRLVQDVALGADVAGERHHHLFADRIDRRVGDLREQLLEVVEQRLRLVGETGQRRVGAHGADRLLALRRPWASRIMLQVFVGVAEGALAAAGWCRDRRRCTRGGSGKLIERDLVFLEPVS